MKKNKRKIFGALGMAVMVLSAGAMAIPVNDPSSVTSVINLKSIQSNPSKFLRTEKIDVSDDYDYIEELRYIYIHQEDELITSVNDGAIKTAIDNEDYAKYQEAIEELLGQPLDKELISREDFEILVQLRNSVEEYNSNHPELN
ncbi:hypothetical protein COU57_04480 [Candidatus Pacearchaeota archaeon CG10_big_fil_rev_8_21_14_0_10_32_14]|nr:MAG: hypothetical protein COU57_04480 [Candidatus Pacearchaeota archaeon CG10_big_fil_rev_8_21_14_0_10_32_14]